MTEIRDYNGKGRWSRESIIQRFAEYSRSLGSSVGELEAVTYDDDSVTWIYPLAESVIKGIENRDRACIELGLELIEDSSSMPFGMILKSNTSRALRKAYDSLTHEQQDRIRRRVADMMITKYMPREFVQYVKLVKKIGFGDEIERVKSQADLSDRWVRHYLDQFEEGEK